MAGKADSTYMHRALELAAHGRGSTKPNPMVGAVIVKGGRVIAEGYHRRAGADHAEIVALKKAGARARGGTLYVTLEPCCHWGRTGPCTEAIRESGLKRVVFASKDPDPRVNGRGAQMLRRAGILVEAGLLRDDAIALNEAYFHFHRTGRPFVILKTAQSLDGRIATATGHSQWISGKEALKYVHGLRADADAIVVGGGTVLRDNPSLTVRLAKGINPYRVIVSSSLNLPRDIKLFANNADLRTVVASTDESIERFSREAASPGLIFWAINATENGDLDLHEFLHQAAAFGLRSLLVEGGGKLATSFLREGLVDKYVVVVAPKVIGCGVSSVGELRVQTLDQAIRFDRHRYEPCGRDMIFVGYPKVSE